MKLRIQSTVGRITTEVRDTMDAAQFLMMLHRMGITCHSWQLER